jgi:uncharacterized protein
MIFIWIILILIITIIMLDQVIQRMYRFEVKVNHINPQRYEIPFEEINIPLANDKRLYAWWMPALPEKPTLILVHGWGRNLARMLPYIEALHPLGYNLIAFDARGHGSSSPEKHASVGTFSEDILSVIDYLQATYPTYARHIGVIGLSIGGGAAINAASWDERIDGVVTVGAISHPFEIINLEFQKRRIPEFIARMIYRYTSLRFRIDFDKIAPVNNIPNAKTDILLIHGSDDETVPLAQAKALQAAAKTDHIRLWVIQGKGHSNCHTEDRFWETIAAFFDSLLLEPVRSQSDQ